MAYTKAKAKQVTYKNDGAGSVVRDLHDKLGEFVSVKDFGAVGDGVTDDTAAIQSAINYVHNDGGGVVNLGQGELARYKTMGQVVVKAGVMLVAYGNETPRGVANSSATILITGGAGSTSNPPSFLMMPGSGMRNVFFNYPNQVAETSSSPVQYPWLIDTTPESPSDPNTDDVVLDGVYLGNCYLGINLFRAGRFKLRHVSGNPIARGLLCDNVLDVCEMTDVHFWPYEYAVETNMGTYIKANCTAYQFGRVDGISGRKISAVAVNEGVVFQDDGNGACWGDFDDVTIDICNKPVVCNQVNQVMFNGGTLTTTDVDRITLETSSDIGAYGSGVGANASLTFVGTRFRGQPFVDAYIKSSRGSVKFVGCHIPKGSAGLDGWRWMAAIVEGAANVTFTGCDPDLTAHIAGSANVVVDGVKLPPSSSNVTSTLANFNMASWSSGAPVNWTPVPSGASSFITQITGGVRLTIPTSGNYRLDYTIPSALREQKDLMVFEFDMLTSANGNSFLFVPVLWGSDGTNIVCNNFSNSYGPVVAGNKTMKVRVPLYLGQFDDTPVLSLYWQGNGASGTVDVTNLKLYTSSISDVTNEQIERLVTSVYTDRYGYGIATRRRGNNKELLAPAVPASGTFSAGDRVIRIPAAVGQPKGWICTVGGTPGTWVSEGNL